MQSSVARSTKGDLVRKAIHAQAGSFSLAELCGQPPAVSVQLVKKSLAEMKRAGEDRLTGQEGRQPLLEGVPDRHLKNAVFPRFDSRFRFPPPPVR
jgi:hypothetical protein